MNEQLRPEDAPPSLYDEHGNPRFFADPAMDRFVAVVMNLAQEVWVQEERLLALEEAKSGETVDRDAKAKEFIERVFAPIRGA
ncbi:MAG: hypothetical protein GVX90_05895 [Alphaproteobacteria bacterium]|jgi:hypothetical protein|nr:hypothetical protein [Alphaproteobacteria bacterium]